MGREAAVMTESYAQGLQKFCPILHLSCVAPVLGGAATMRAQSQPSRPRSLTAFTAIVVPGAIPVSFARGSVTTTEWAAVPASPAGAIDDAATSGPHATTYFLTPFSGLGVHFTSAALPS